MGNIKGRSENKQIRVLIFEDYPSIAIMLKKIIENSGYEVFVFPDPTFCPCIFHHIDRCQKQFPCADIMISDIQMPHIDGITFYSLLRKKGCKIPQENKALMSASAKWKRTLFPKEITNCFFSKPFNLGKIKEWLEACAVRIPENRILSEL